MRGLLAFVRRSPLPFALVAYAAVRASTVLGRPVARFPDTAGWLDLTWWGENSRLWPVPAVLSLAGSDGARVAVQFVLGTAAWVHLAVTLSRVSRFPRAISLVTLAVGLSPQVTRWDLAILSESLGITFSVLAVTLTVRLVHDRGSQLAWMAAVSLVGLTRPTHVIIVITCAAVCIVVAARSRARPMLLPAMLLSSVSLWGLVLVNGNAATSRLNVYTVLANDAARSDDTWNWFVEAGMPDVPGARDAAGYDFTGALPDDLAALVELPVGQQPPAIVRAGGIELATWVRDHGVSTLTRWALTHPADVVTTAADRADAVLSPPNDDFLPLGTRTLWPRTVFGPWQMWVGAWAAAALLTLLRLRAGRSVRAIVAMGTAVGAVYLVTMTYSGIEHQRHGATVAVAMRTVALASLALALPRRADQGDDVSEDPRPRGGRGART